MQKYNWNYPTTMWVGENRINDISLACKSLKINKPLLVTDKGLAQSDIVKSALTILKDGGISVALYSNVIGNPTGTNVNEGVSSFKKNNCDGVIAFGGGSGLDVGKAVAFMSGQTLPIWDFEDVGDNWTRVNADGVAPIVAVPTTSGTGSEVGRASVIANEETHTKKVIFHPTMLPQVVICDPELVTGLPPALTAYTGMDALVHCFEAYCAPGYHPMAEGIALEGMRLVQQWLPAAVKDGSDIEARTHMMSAAAMGATAFQKGLGAVHSLSHPVGSIYDTHHGLTNAVFMPYVMNFNRPAIEGQMDILARYLDLPGSGFSAVMDWVLELRQTFNIANTPVDLGVEENRLYELSEMAANDPTAGGNPIPVGTNEMKVMYQAAMAGRL